MRPVSEQPMQAVMVSNLLPHRHTLTQELQPRTLLQAHIRCPGRDSDLHTRPRMLPECAVRGVHECLLEIMHHGGAAHSAN
jgi:hypothetical protein